MQCNSVLWNAAQKPRKKSLHTENVAQERLLRVGPGGVHRPAIKLCQYLKFNTVLSDQPTGSDARIHVNMNPFNSLLTRSRATFKETFLDQN